MRLNTLLFAASASLMLAAAPAAAQQNIDGWDLNDDGESCALSYSNEAGTALTMLNDGKYDAMGFVIDGLGGVEKGAPITLQMQIGTSEWVDLNAVGISLSTGAAGYMLGNFPVDVFAERPMRGTLRIRRGTEVIHSFPLDNINRGAKAMVECGKKYG